MSKYLVWGLLALALLCILCLFFRAPAIQDDIQARTGTALETAGFDTSTMSVSGRDVTLTVTVPNEEARARAEEVAQSVWGVRAVDNQLQVAAVPAEAAVATTAAAAPMPGRLELIKHGPTLTLRGSVPSEEAREALVAQAESVWGEGNVIDELTIDPALDPLPEWLPEVTDAMALRRGDLTVTLADRTATVQGEVLSELTEERILGAASTLMPGFDIVDDLVVVEPEDDLERLQHQLDTMLRGKVVEFDSDSAELTDKGRTVLDELIAALEAAPGQILIAGHTDYQASQEYNLELSQRRAEAVRDYFVANGLDTGRFVIRGYGETEPIASNDTEEGRQRNRRTEFHVLEEN